MRYTELVERLFPIVNDFIEDTAVIIVIAYLLTRGRFLPMFFAERIDNRKAVVMGLGLGLAALTETVFPGARFPYVTSTLIVTFAAISNGFRTAIVSATVVTTGALILMPWRVVPSVVTGVYTCAVLGKLCQRTHTARHRLLDGFLTGMLTQAASIGIQTLFRHSPFASKALSQAILSVPANGAGIVLLYLVLHDARLRAESEQLRTEAEQARALVAEARLTALRSRIHPHFLFNTLTSIAGLCGLDPQKAENAIVRLGAIMRRALETNPSVAVRLEEELDYVRNYVEIEEQRLGKRLRVVWRLASDCRDAMVPPFAIQTLVENAVNHGVAADLRPGKVILTVRKGRRHTLVAVQDTGVGMNRETLAAARTVGTERPHGIEIATQQLVLLHGRQARLRVFSVEDAGTLIAFAIPMSGVSARNSRAADGNEAKAKRLSCPADSPGPYGIPVRAEGERNR